MRLKRENTEPIEIITREDGTQHLEGYAMRFYDGSPETEYALSSGKVERIARADIESTLLQVKSLPLRYNHSKDYVLDDTDHTLTLRCDDKGLRFSAPFDSNDPDHMKVKCKIDKGIIRGSSFEALGMHRWEKDGEKSVGWVKDLDFKDVSIVNSPAYEGTSAMVRSAEELEEIEREHNDAFKIELPKEEPKIDEREVLIRSLEEKVAQLERQISEQKEYKYLQPQTLPSVGNKDVKEMTSEEFKRYINSI